MIFDFVFDLQAFADEGTVAPAGASAPASPAPPIQAAQDTTSSSESIQSAPQYGLVTDSSTGRKAVVPIEGDHQAVADTQTGVPAADAAPADSGMQQGLMNGTSAQQMQSQPYGEQEFLVALQMNAVDESRVPAQYAVQYGAFKARQQLAQQQAARQEATLQEGESQRMADETQKAFYQQIATAAHQKALAATGMTQDEYDAAQYSDGDDDTERMRAYDAAYRWSENEIVRAAYEQQALMRQHAQERAALYSDINNSVAEKRANEPHFAEIDVLMESRYKTLPYQEAQDIAHSIEALRSGTITLEQCKTLEKYYEDTRIAFYAQRNNLQQMPRPAQRPPTVETPGSGANVPPQAIDFAAMRNMSTRERQVFLGNYFQNKNR